MIVRAASFCISLGCGAALSQFPEYSQQYIQRLGGAVDELAIVVSDFDTSARLSNLTRDQALEQLSGAPFLERRRNDMVSTFARFERLRDDLTWLENANHFQRVLHLPRFTDKDIAARAWQAFVPAIPLTIAGATFAIVGFISGLLGLSFLGRMVRALRPAS